ncbi:MAG: bifunctional riboflavin kinase/FAD synthetase [Chitinophagaceae bacterium]
MQVHKDLDQLPIFRKAVVTIGTFDGVHLGHRQVIASLNKEARAIGGESVIITFHPHPRKIVSSPNPGVQLINTLEEKLELLKNAGVDHVVVVPFTESFAGQTAEEYIENFLVGRFNPHTVIIGFDHRFGRERKGDYLLLERFAPVFAFRLEEIPKHLLDDIGISSTRIREAILQCEPEKATGLLGYEFFFSGLVVDGDKLGRELGYPTANLRVENEEKLIPGNGIYAVYAQLQNRNDRLKGMMSIGFRPTVNGQKRVIEVNLFDFDGDIYGQHLRVYIKKYLRAEVKYDSLEALVRQIDLDKIKSLEVL